LTRKVTIAEGATLYLGDCREILPSISADVLITDPPYGVNLGNHRGASDTRASVLKIQGYESYDDTPENFDEIVVPAITTALSLVDRGAVFMAGKSAWKLPPADVIGGIYLPSGMGRNPWGFASMQHCLLYGSAPDLFKTGARATAIYSTETSEKNGHPCPKPIGWMKWLVSLASREDETVVDPFMGSGTTGVACVQLGRKFIGIEIEPKYFDIACRRIELATKQQDFFIAKPKPVAHPTFTEIWDDPSYKNAAE
jgi:site-specific DNA-methyltransferase (adenine-specific)